MEAYAIMLPTNTLLNARAADPTFQCTLAALAPLMRTT